MGRLCHFGTTSSMWKVWSAAPVLLLAALTVTNSDGLVTKYDESSSRLLILSSSKDRNNVELGYLTVHNNEGLIAPCSEDSYNEDCYELEETVISQGFEGRAGRCLNMSASSNSSGTIRIMQCLNHLGSHIYGGLEQNNQYWPIESNVYDNYSYITKQQDNVGIAERYWLFSDGRYIYVPQYVPLFIDQNTNLSVDMLCLIAERRSPYPVNRQDIILETYTCEFDGGVREAHEDAVEKFLGRPSGVPDERMATHPIWSTWARYKRDITEATVRELADEILANGFNNSQLEIDDLWETCYGSLDFDTAKFPDIRALTDDLHAMGFRVTLWVHPFLNLDCEPYHREALSSGYLVLNTDGSPNSTWWNGDTSVVDFTNPEAATWWTGRLWALREAAGIDSFKFDAGDTSWLPQLPDIQPLELNPVQFSSDYVQTASQFGPMVEVHTGERSQHLPVYIRMIDKDSRWGFDNGLATMVTTLLQMNMVGYTLVLPDMVGGNGYGSDVVTKELFIRWLQANVFMPSIQFSYVPWDFDQETVEISRNLTALHAQYSPLIVQLMQRAVEDGSPINPPIWWIDPTDETALVINSEYLLGEDILVAPVLEEGAVSRDIYLPAGSWRDEADPTHPILQGPAWLMGYPAPLHTLPFFSRVASH